jgi:tetratricopeptide (TPR) repeat protein
MNSQRTESEDAQAIERKPVTHMIRDARFWIPLSIFQLIFGLAIFGLTRDYYLNEGDRSGVAPATRVRTSTGPPPGFLRPEVLRPASPAWDSSMPQDPAEISRQADEAFGNKQYEQAADLYGRLLAIAPRDAETHNNLGLTLHYLGRSTEALRTLNEGVAIDPRHQRIRLTLGYVNKQVGNDEVALEALTNATLIGNDEAIRKSAMEMLRDLP